MIVYLKYTMPAVVPFVLAGIIKLMFAVTGATLNPEAHAAVSLFFGFILGFFLSVLLVAGEDIEAPK